MRFILALCLGLMAAQPANADAITDVISEQLDAFRAGDTARAFSYASPMIQGIFGEPDQFGAMVREGYPAIWAPSPPRFTAREESGAATLQRVLILDKEGVAHIMEYEMIEQAEGWKINGVREVPAPDISA
ncbi:MAG: hypothetical protein ACJA06_001407 [Halocynthiibacter sp.]|jgi:hypothetical protein